MEEKEQKWIFIEKSSETVRYKKKAGDSDSSMDDNCHDDDDFEYLPPTTSSNPGNRSPTSDTYEFIPSKSDRRRACRDEIEIHDNHFSSCPTSEMEDSDIEVVIKSPSSSETASLCSFNSQKSGDANDASLILPYDDLLFTSQKSVVNDATTPTAQPSDRLLFNLNMSDSLPTSEAVSALACRNNEEEDSEVEVISRSIHRNGSIEVSFVADLLNNHELGMMHESVSSSASENEHEDEPEEEEETVITSKSILPLLLQQDEIKMVDELCSNKDSEEEEGHQQTDNEVDELEKDEEEEEKENGVEEIPNNIDETDSEEEEEDNTNDNNNMNDDSFDDVKCFLRDFHVGKQINSRLVGLKTSTLALTVCLSITLGVYLGNYMNPSPTGHFDDTFFVPDDILSTGTDPPPRVNITFKYSTSTRDTLQGMVTSFQKLKQDYDRLHVAYEDMKERFNRKQQMSLYWRKHARKDVEQDEKTDDSSKQVKNVTRHNIHKIFRKSYLSGLNLNNGTHAAPAAAKQIIINNFVSNSTLLAQEKTIHKLTRDLINQRKSTKYWKKQFQDIELSRVNKCSRYDDPDTASFSFKDCFNIFSKVIPSLDITAMNITNRAENLAGQVQNAWSRLVSSTRWNPRKFVKKSAKTEDSVNSHKVKRFRRIFVISNVASSSKHRIHHRNTTADQKQKDFDDVMFLTEDNGDNNCDANDAETGIILSSATLHFGDTPSCKKDYNTTCNCDTKNDGDNSNHINENNGDNEHDKNNNGNKIDESSNNDITNNDDKNDGDNDVLNNAMDFGDDHNATEANDGESDWYRARYHQSQFMLNAYKYVYEYESDTLKSKHIDELRHEREEHAKKIAALRTLERENMILQEKLKHRDARIENAKNKLKALLVAEMTRCNSTISSVKDALESNCKTVLNNVEETLKHVARYRYESLLTSERKRYEALIRNVKRVIRRVEKSKLNEKLRELKEKLEHEQETHYKKIEKKNRFKVSNNKKKENNGERKMRRHNYKLRDSYKKNNKYNRKNNNKYNKNDKNYKKGDDDMEKKSKFKIRSRRDDSEYFPFTKNGRKNFEKNKKLKHHNKKKFTIFSGGEDKNYARKYKETKHEVRELKKIYDEAVKRSQFQEELITGYRRQMENYRQTIVDYEQAMTEVRQREVQQREELVHLTEQIKNLDAINEENEKLKKSLNVEKPLDTAKELDKRMAEEGREIRNEDLDTAPFNEIPKRIVIYSNPTNKDEIVTIKEYENISYVTTEDQKTSKISIYTLRNDYDYDDIFREGKSAADGDEKEPGEEVEEEEQKEVKDENDKEKSEIPFILENEPKRVIMYFSPLNRDELVTINEYENISYVTREDKKTSKISLYTLPQDYDFSESFYEGKDRLVHRSEQLQPKDEAEPKVEQEEEKRKIDYNDGKTGEMPSWPKDPKQITMYENPMNKDEVITIKEYENMSYATKTNSNGPEISIFSLPKNYDFNTVTRIVNKHAEFKGESENTDPVESGNAADEEDAENIPEKMITQQTSSGDEEKVTVREYEEFSYVLKREKLSELNKPDPDISFPEDFVAINGPEFSAPEPPLLPPQRHQSIPGSTLSYINPENMNEKVTYKEYEDAAFMITEPLSPTESDVKPEWKRVGKISDRIKAREMERYKSPPLKVINYITPEGVRKKITYRNLEKVTQVTKEYMIPVRMKGKSVHDFDESIFSADEELMPQKLVTYTIPKGTHEEDIIRDINQNKATHKRRKVNKKEQVVEKENEVKEDSSEEEGIIVSSSYLNLPCINTENTTATSDDDFVAPAPRYTRITIGKPSKYATIMISGKIGEYEVISFNKADGSINDKGDDEENNDVTGEEMQGGIDDVVNASSAFYYKDNVPSFSNSDCHDNNDENKDGRPFFNIEDMYPADLFRRSYRDEGPPSPGKPSPPPFIFAEKKNLPALITPPAPIPPARVQEQQYSSKTEDESSFVVDATNMSYEEEDEESTSLAEDRDEDFSAWPEFNMATDKAEPISIRSVDEEFQKAIDEDETRVEEVFMTLFKPETHGDEYLGSEFSPEHHGDGDEEDEQSVIPDVKESAAPTFAPGSHTETVSLLGAEPQDEGDMGPSFAPESQEEDDGPSFAPESAKEKDDGPSLVHQFFMDDGSSFGPSFGPSFGRTGEEEEEEEDNGPSFAHDGPKKLKGETEEDNWFLRSMRERHNLRVSKGSKNIDWLWKYMTEREKMRTATAAFRESDVNWFLKAMKEREEIRKQHEDENEDNWFVKAMKERENLRDSHDD